MKKDEYGFFAYFGVFLVNDFATRCTLSGYKPSSGPGSICCLQRQVPPLMPKNNN